MSWEDPFRAGRPFLFASSEAREFYALVYARWSRSEIGGNFAFVFDVAVVVVIDIVVVICYGIVVLFLFLLFVGIVVVYVVRFLGGVGICHR